MVWILKVVVKRRVGATTTTLFIDEHKPDNTPLDKNCKILECGYNSGNGCGNCHGRNLGEHKMLCLTPIEEGVDPVVEFMEKRFLRELSPMLFTKPYPYHEDGSLIAYPLGYNKGDLMKFGEPLIVEDSAFDALIEDGKHNSCQHQK